MKPVHKLTSLTSSLFLLIGSISAISLPAPSTFAATTTSTSLAVATSVSNDSSVSSSIPTSNLSIGMSGSAVSTLQQNLKNLDFFQYSSITGYFGTVTQTAVMSLQSAYGLKADGIDGPITNAAIAHALVKKQLVADTSQYIGTRYQWGGTSPSTGFDCSGFIYYIFQQHGITSVPRTTSSLLYNMGTPIDRSHLQPGDLVFFSIAGNGTISHVGIYIGNGNFISPLSSKGVYVQTLDTTYWSPKYIGAKRIY